MRRALNLTAKGSVAGNTSKCPMEAEIGRPCYRLDLRSVSMAATIEALTFEAIKLNGVYAGYRDGWHGIHQWSCCHPVARARSRPAAVSSEAIDRFKMSLRSLNRFISPNRNINFNLRVIGVSALFSVNLKVSLVGSRSALVVPNFLPPIDDDSRNCAAR